MIINGMQKRSQGDFRGPGAVVVALVMLMSGCGLSLAGDLYWSPPVNISASGDDGFYSGKASLVRDLDGHLHCVWFEFEDGQFDNAEHKYANNVTGGWVKYDLSVSGIGGYGREKALAVTPDNRIHLLFKNNGIRAASKDPADSSFGSVELLASEEEAIYVQDLAVDGNGALYALMLEVWDGGGSSELSLRKKPLGGSWGSVEVMRDKVSYLLVGGHLTPWGTSKMICGWSDNRKPCIRIMDAAGNWGSKQELSYSCFGGFEMAQNPQGNTLAALYGYDDGTDAYFNVYCKISTDGGATWGSEITVADRVGLEGGPHGTFDNTGKLHMVWMDMVNRPYIRYNSYEAGTWGNAESIWKNDNRTSMELRPVRCFSDGIYLDYNETRDGHEDVLLTIGYFDPPETPFQTNTPTVTRTRTITLTPTVTLTPTRTNTSRFGNPTSTPTYTTTSPPTATPSPTPEREAAGVQLW